MRTDYQGPETGEKGRDRFFRRFWLGLVSLAALLLVVGLCFGAGVFWSARNQGAPEITADLLTARVQQAQELVTVKYFYTNVGKFEKSSNFYGWRIPFSAISFLISYEGKFSAGVNLSRASVIKEGQRVIITLPRPEILSHEIDQDSLKVYDESRNLFNPISIEDYAQFSVDQQQAMEQKAMDGGLLEEAKGAAERTLTGLLTALEQEEEPWQITFRYLS